MEHTNPTLAETRPEPPGIDQRPPRPACPTRQRRCVKIVVSSIWLDQCSQWNRGDAVVDAESCGAGVDQESCTEGVAESVSQRHKVPTVGSSHCL